ncbi:hypothetical protein KIN20_030197 [Parelaphostrongylus tenuis]|uniref:Uncharacterized protein n=1 Tax=Parelaphostrongylus tenuis TaxID=148309 RepID=A0AAD5R3J7_PARTN|nr:hypothetical protein KIN20_030197 [Parelaphostrongylus tenuis]
MNIFTDIAKPPTGSFIILLLATISAVFGCGVILAGQQVLELPPSAASRLCLLRWFTLKKPMVSSQVPGISTSKEGAQAFVSRLVMQTVLDVLERQARSVLLPDFVISGILDQVKVRVTYKPLSCQRGVLDITKALDPEPMTDDSTASLPAIR